MKKEFGHALRELRKKKGLSQQQVADCLGIAKTNVSRYENGLQLPELDKLEPLGKLLGVMPSEILAFAETGNVMGTVPLISWVQAGDWKHTADTGLYEAERIPTTWKPHKYTFALRVRGDSMEPKFPDGCIIIVEPEEVAINGSFIVVNRNGSEATFKQLVQDGSKTFLKPLNPRYPILEIPEDARICGVVKRIEMDV